MGQDRILHWARRRLRWLLWLAMVLPAAQLASAVHAFSHLRDPVQTQRGDPDLAHLQHCPICPVAAVVGAGGLPSTPPGILLDLAPAAAPVAAPADRIALAPPRFYASRAPPPLLH